jgi:chromosome segregation ATPase
VRYFCATPNRTPPIEEQPSPMSTLEERVAALEAEVTRLREQTTDTHALAAHADRDVAEFRNELRAQTRLISALRETQVEHYEEHKADTGQVKAEVTALRTEMVALRTEMVAKFDQVQGGLEQVVTMLGALGGQEGES